MSEIDDAAPTTPDRENTRPARAGFAPEPNPHVEDEAPERRQRATRTRAPRKAKPARRVREDTRPARAVRSRETSSMSRAVLERGIADTIQGVAIAVTILDAEDGAIIARGEPKLTKALIDTAEQNPRFKRRLEELLQGGTYMQLAVAVGAIVLPITMRHVPMPAAFRQAAVMAQSAGEGVPNTVPAEWQPFAPAGDVLLSPDGTPLQVGVIYRDAEGPYTVDEAGNVVPLPGADSPDGDAAA